MADWGYGHDNGPHVWPDRYAEARGVRQSPIDIVTAQVQASAELVDRPLTWNYESQVCKSVINTGCGWRVDVDPGERAGGLINGPLDQCYELIQFHAHWGNTSREGSEHVVDGKPYAGELHFVHWNKDFHANCADAVSAPKGLCVLGVFLEVGESNPEMDRLCDVLRAMPYRDERRDLPQDFDPTAFYPNQHSYWTYEGSLTTPPCYESVVWVVFKKPITVSADQLECFRGLHDHLRNDTPGDFCGRVSRNFRPPQALNARVIRSCNYD